MATITHLLLVCSLVACSAAQQADNPQTAPQAPQCWILVIPLFLPSEPFVGTERNTTNGEYCKPEEVTDPSILCYEVHDYEQPDPFYPQFAWRWKT